MENVATHYRVSIADTCGNIVYDKTDESKSFTRNFIYLMGAMFDDRDCEVQTTSGAWKLTKGFTIDINDEGITEYGIVIGDGTSDVTFDDYILDHQIDDPEVTHSSMNGIFKNLDYWYDENVGNYKSHWFTRYFRNLTGVPVTINEIGVAVKSKNDYYLIIRDILPSPITLQDGYTLTVEYILTTSRSFTKNFHSIMFSSMNGGIAVDMVDTSNVVRSESFNGITTVRSMDNNIDYGLIIGTGNTDISFDDYTVEAPIPCEYASGIVHQSGVALSNKTQDGDIYNLDMRRTFTNLGMFDVYVSEIGLVTKSPSGNYYLLVHSKETGRILSDEVLDIKLRIQILL